MEEGQKCYMCNAPAVSMEHVPPKCIFPEIRETGGHDYRKELLRVPSCDVHNSRKSHDDEFLMVSLAGIVGNNSIGYEHYHTKVQRALARTSSKLLDQVFKNKESFEVEKNNEFMQIIMGNPDYDRLIRCFEHIAHGIHRHHFECNFTGQLMAILGFIYNAVEDAENFKKMVSKKVTIELEGKEKYGRNPDVFYYQFTDVDEFGLFVGKFCFYRNVEVFVAFKPDDAKEPFNLAVALMNSGIQTTFHFDDEEFTFNKG